MIEEEIEVVEDTSPADTASEEVTEVASKQNTEEYHDLNETTRQTTERIFNELKEKNSDGDQGKEGEAQAEAKVTKNPNLNEKEEPEDKFDPDLNPPERLKDRAKAMFNNLPKGLKREFHRAIKEIESGGTRVVQEAQKAIQETRAISEVIAPFATKWAERGFSVPSGIASLCAAQEKLTNPQTSLEAYLNLGADLGHIEALPDQIKQYAQHFKSQNQNILDNPQIRSLHERQDQIIEMMRQQQLSPVVSEMEAVRQEVDPASGKFRYPELSDESYLLSLKTRVSEIVRHDPSISYADALRKAADERRQLWFGYSNNPQQTRIPTANNNQQKERAVNAAVSVRGRVNPVSNGQLDLEPPPEALANPRATAEWALQQIRSGRI